MGQERWPGPAWGSHVTFLFFWAKGQRPLGVVGEGPEPASTTFPHTLPVSSPEASASGQGQRAEHVGSKRSGWGLLFTVEAWIPGFRVLLGSVAEK